MLRVRSFTPDAAAAAGTGGQRVRNKAANMMLPPIAPHWQAEVHDEAQCWRSQRAGSRCRNRGCKHAPGCGKFRPCNPTGEWAMPTGHVTCSTGRAERLVCNLTCQWWFVDQQTVFCCSCCLNCAVLVRQEGAYSAAGTTEAGTFQSCSCFSSTNAWRKGCGIGCR